MGKERAVVVYDYGNNDLFNNIKSRSVNDIGSEDEKNV